MKKFILSIIFGIGILFSMGSCATAVEAQSDGVYASNGIDFDVIISYGTPIYDAEGLLTYYIYRDLYYYPYYVGNRWYFRGYNRPIRHYRPVNRDFYRHRPPVHHHPNNVRPNRPPVHHGNVRPNGNTHRPNVGSRPSGGVNHRPHNSSFGGGRPSSNIGSGQHHSSGGRGFGGRR